MLGEPVEPVANVNANLLQRSAVSPRPGATSAFGQTPPLAAARGSAAPALAAPGLIAPGSIAAVMPPAAGSPPAQLPGSGEAGPALAKQINAEVTRQQSLARDMREKQPKQALENLQRTREMVSTVSGLESTDRALLLRRLDSSINEVQQYIAKNGPALELEEKNRKVEQEVDNNRKRKVEVQEKLAYLVNDFNRAIDEQRYSEAQVLAKKAAELDPENLVVMQLNVMAKQISRMAQIDQLKGDKESAFIDTMFEVDKTSIPYPGDFGFPDIKKWDKLSKSPFRRQREGQLRRSPQEKEIEQRLNTPVACKFQKRPLADVIELLGKYASVPTYLDPQGLQAEGVMVDTPVTIDLAREISLKSALNLILDPLRLTYVIKNDVLKITSEDAKRGELYPVTYFVGDLVIPIPNFTSTGREGINGAFREAYDRMGWSGAAGGSFGAPAQLAVASNDQNSAFASNPAVLAQMGQRTPIPIIGSGQTSSGSPQSIPFGPGGMKGGQQADFDSLIDLIVNTIQPTTWSETGGPGAIQQFETNLSLVISQTQ